MRLAQNRSSFLNTTPAEAWQAIHRFVGSFACHTRVLVLSRAGLAIADHISNFCAPSQVTLVPIRIPRLTAALLRRRAETRIRIISDLRKEDPFDLVIAIGADQSAVQSALPKVENGTLILLGCEISSDTLQRFDSVEPFSLVQRSFGGYAVLPEPKTASAEIIVARAVADEKLHIGSGPQILPGWTNIDNKPYPGVKRLLDLRFGLPFRDVEFIFMEHFIEHLELRDGLALLKECRAALGPTGVLRVSTPNLDWVWATSYHRSEWSSDTEVIRDCLVINRAFRGWGHKFLYNMTMLRETLQQAGFSSVEPARYGESRHASLKNLERHEQYPDSPELPHILIVEASGHGKHEVPQQIEEQIAEFERDVSAT